jgi:RNA polymerase sigma-70 factor, ECF subfamily
MHANMPSLMNRDETVRTSPAQPGAHVGDLARALADDAAFETWYRRTVPRVFSYLLARSGDAGLAEELCQETYLAAIAQRARYDGRSDTVGWLCGIARHKLADHFRRLQQADRRRLRLEVREITLASAPSPDRMADHLAIADALRSLPPLQRAMLTFVALDGLSVAEAGRLIGKSHPAAQSILFRAREAFRQAYREDGAS